MRTLITYLFLLCAVAASALTIPQGTLYFDNSRTRYQAVRFVYGSDQRPETYALIMTQDGNKWRVEIPQTVTDMYRFTFVGGNIPEGRYNQNFNSFKDSISHQANLQRTATSEAQMQAGDIFVPESGDNWAQGYWTSLEAWLNSQSSTPSATVSGTLPVVYIRTQNNAAINSKETYVAGSLYIDALTTGYLPLGSAAAPIPAQFKGRGNWTWSGFDKKPYRIKFDTKQAVLGMPNNRHWCLLAHADDCMGYLKNTVGFLLSQEIGLRYTPRFVPVELVINDQYQGLYFLTEQVRIAGNRVHITEQQDNATDSVTGGWLVEIDNYSEEGNINLYEGNGEHVMISIKEPEVLSAQQRQYIEQQMNRLNEAIWGNSSSQLTALLDLDEAAKYYLVQELMEDCESYHGSCYLYKDRDRNGQTDRWKFGPVWDFGNAYNRNQDTWIYDNPIFAQYWIGQLAEWSEFQAKVREQWYVYYHSHMQNTRTQINDFVTLISAAAKNDAVRWRGTQNYCDNSSMTSRKNDFLNRLNHRIQWLYSQWGEGTKPATWDVPEIESSTPKDAASKLLLPDGRIVIRRGNQTYDINGRPINF
ncbi:MAG: CotH kinase family protein [Paludibacteraceae bacterium]|nr:CotH kinase family protein [Paludibacteraceae bacterium]